MDFFFPSFLPWAFVTAFGVAYVLLREDADRIDRLALSGALGAGMAVVVVASLIFWMLGIPPFST
jgi:hypothetical protein